MGSTSSSLLRSLPFPFSPEIPAVVSLKPHPQNPPSSQLPNNHLPFSVSSPSTKALQLALNQFQNSSPSSTVPTTTNPFPFLDSDALPVSIQSLLCPSVAYANVYFYKPYNVQIIPREDDEKLWDDWIVKRFNYATANAGVFYEMKRRRFFESPREKKMTKSKRAAKLLKRSKMKASRGIMKPKPQIAIYRDPLEEKKRKGRLAANRRRKQKRHAGFKQKQKGSDQSVELVKKESYNSDDDNWEF